MRNAQKCGGLTMPGTFVANILIQQLLTVLAVQKHSIQEGAAGRETRLTKFKQQIPTV